MASTTLIREYGINKLEELKGNTLQVRVVPHNSGRYAQQRGPETVNLSHQKHRWCESNPADFIYPARSSTLARIGVSKTPELGAAPRRVNCSLDDATNRVRDLIELQLCEVLDPVPARMGTCGFCRLKSGRRIYAQATKSTLFWEDNHLIGEL